MSDHVVGVFYRFDPPVRVGWVADCSCGWRKPTIDAKLAQKHALEHHRDAKSPEPAEDARSRPLDFLKGRA